MPTSSPMSFPGFLFRRVAPLILSAAFISPAILAAGALSWEFTEHSVTTTPEQENVAVIYPFRNATDHAIRITALDTGCTCTTAEVSKNDYAPGESGELKVKFILGERVGRQERTVTVTTDDKTALPSAVKLVVDIPELAVVRPRLLFWQSGAKPETKTAEIVLTHPENSRLDAPQSTSTAFSVKLEPTGRAGVYRLKVTPTGTAETAHAVIHISAIIQGSTRILAVFAAVK